MFYKIAINNIDIAVEEINKITDNQKFNVLREELNRTIVNAVSSIAVYYERMDYSKLAQDDDTYLRAFAYLNNQIKHDKNLNMIYYDVSGSMYPMSYPMRYGKPGVYWSDFKNNGRPNSRGKREHYDLMLRNKDIEVTLLKVKEIFDNYFENIS
ncbi:MAG: hypothetical protein IJ362_05625 [Oscillospiraceae bacterium]|nr:hypothetical protein [Oscillospiraceae bacterium]